MKRRPPRSTLLPYATLFRSADDSDLSEPTAWVGEGAFDNGWVSEDEMPWDEAPQHITEEYRTAEDRKSTRLNSSHANISYAVFCLKKQNQIHYFVPTLLSPI